MDDLYVESFDVRSTLLSAPANTCRSRT